MEQVMTDNKHFNSTLFLSNFMGILGVHRIINGKKVSGFFMLFITLATILIPVIVSLFTFKTSNVFNFLMYIIQLPIALFPLSLIVPVWAVIDTFMILFGKFKNSNTGEYVNSSNLVAKIFLKLLVVVSMIIGLVLIYMFLMLYFEILSLTGYE